jgi:hypothetical protein
MRGLVGRILFILCLHSLSPQQMVSQWSTDPTTNKPISTAANGQVGSMIIGDGSGGAIITWSDGRDGGGDIYAQRINNAGDVLWTANGVPVSMATEVQFDPIITSDGFGGAIIVWRDRRNGSGDDLYAQRVNHAGQVQWTSDGVGIVTASGLQTNPTLTSDGSGGAIITWEDWRVSGTNTEIYAQRINGAGVVQWPANGLAISTAAGYQEVPVIIDDGSGGAIIVWIDARSGTNSDIYAQRINGAGVVQWTANGVPISAATGSQIYPAVTGDGSGGATISWRDGRSDTNYDVYAQRITGAGVVQWTADGVPVSEVVNPASEFRAPAITADGSGGSIIAWSERRGASNVDIYAQRINGAGQVQWTSDGVAISTATLGQQFPAIVGDGFGGAIITWQDQRSGFSRDDVYAQRINGAGVAQWTSDGLAISTASYRQGLPRIASDGMGGAIITWEDTRNGPGTTDIYVQNVDRFGYFGINAPSLTGVRDVPGDQGGRVTLAWDGADLDAYPHRFITHYSVWRGIDLTAKPAEAAFINPEDMAPAFHGPAYRTMMTSSGTTYWEWLANMPSHSLSGYSLTASTTTDSTPGGTPYFKYFVSAHTENPFVFWDSNVDSGYSVDNLRPETAHSLIAQVQAGPSVLLRWGRNTGDPDVGAYEVHRSTVDGFVPGPSSRIAQTADTMLADGTPDQGTTNFYRVVTVDIHGNRSAPSEQASAVVTGVMEQEGGVPTSYTLEQNYPNPFNPTTVIQYALPVAGHVKLTVYTTLGEEVAVLIDEEQEAGYRSVTWHAASIPSGVYLYRLQAGGFAEARKLLLVK